MAKKNQNNKALLPELRFPEFSGDAEWDCKKLSLLAKPVKEKATKLSPKDVLTLSGEHGLVRQTDYFGKKIAGADLKRYLRIEQDDFVYNDRTTSAAKYGSLKRLTNYDVGAVSPIYKCFRFKEKQNPVFWEHYFDAGAHETELSEFINEGARAGRFNISVDTFLSIAVCYPSGTEQQKIADCLGSLDDLIAAHSAKLDALQDHKKGLLKQLFPVEGETVPSLRFPEFENAGEWSEEPLLEMFNIQDGFAFSSTDFVEASEGSQQVIRITDINNRNSNTDKVYFPRRKAAEMKLSRYLAHKGDLLLSLTGAAGFNFFIWAGDDSLLNQRTAKISPKDKKHSTLAHLLNPLIHGKINNRGEGQNNNLSRGFLATVTLPVPEPPEQKRIADCLSALDALITAQAEQIAALDEHKKGLMQQLFPNPELSKA